MFRSHQAAASLAVSLLLGGAVVAASPAARAADKVIVFYAACDGTGASDTVKIKRVDDDATNATVIGDSGVADCQGGPATPARHFAGFAVSGEHGYFGWFDHNGAEAGIGRIRLDGTGAATLAWHTAAAPVSQLVIAPTVAAGSIFMYLNDSNFAGVGPQTPRIAKVATATAAFTDGVVTAGAGSMSLTFGVGKDRLLWTDDTLTNQILKSTAFDGTGTATVMTLINNDYFSFDYATMAAESSTKIFVRAGDTGDGSVGISAHPVASPGSAFARPVVPLPAVAPNLGVMKIVWGGNHLYYIDSTARKIGRTSDTGPGDLTTFASVASTGPLHAISPALASTVTVSAPAAATTVPSAGTPTTTTATTVAAKVAPVIGKSGTTHRSLASWLGLSVPSGAKVSATVAASSKSYCRVSGTKVVALKSGRCRVTVTVTPKKGAKKSKTTTLTVKK